jgi:hypothetical protein
LYGPATFIVSAKDFTGTPAPGWLAKHAITVKDQHLFYKQELMSLIQALEPLTNSASSV